MSEFSIKVNVGKTSHPVAYISMLIWETPLPLPDLTGIRVLKKKKTTGNPDFQNSKKLFW